MSDVITTRALNEKYADCVRQLTEAHARIDRFESAPKGWWHKEVESLRQQLAHREAQIVRMRDAIEYGFDNPDFDGETFDRQLQEALDATADLENVRLCEKEPVAWMGHEYCVGYQHAPNDTPLYRAWEPK